MIHDDIFTIILHWLPRGRCAGMVGRLIRSVPMMVVHALLPIMKQCAHHAVTLYGGFPPFHSNTAQAKFLFNKAAGSFYRIETSAHYPYSLY